MIPILLTPQAAIGTGTLTASATLTATGRKAVGHTGGTLTEALGFTVTGRKATSGVGGDIAGAATLVGAGEQTAAGEGTITLHDSWTANDVWLVDDVTGLPLVDDVTGEWLWMDGHTPQVKRTSGVATLTQPAIFASTATRTSSGSGTLSVPHAMAPQDGAKQGFGTGAIAESVSFTSTGVRVPTGHGSIILAATLTGTGRKAASGTGALAVTPVMARTGRKGARGTGALALTAAMAATGTAGGVVPVTPQHIYGTTLRRRRPERHSGTGEMRLYPLMWATGVKTYESDDELVLALAA
jgi:hypothetical protein